MNSSTGYRASSGRASRESKRRSSMMVREITGSDSSSRIAIPVSAPIAPATKDGGDSRMG